MSGWPLDFIIGGSSIGVSKIIVNGGGWLYLKHIHLQSNWQQLEFELALSYDYPPPHNNNNPNNYQNHICWAGQWSSL